MQSPAPSSSILHGREQHFIGKELAILDHHINLGDVHVNDATGADIQMTYFAVAHLTGWQSDIAPAGVHQRAGILAQQFVVNRLARQRDAIALSLGTKSPAVENDKNQWCVLEHE